ncbi:peptidase T [uncultured Gimesia sp.]|uniref:peptidase T n=1 Tax=uncultured Gimesia sp. TaxID=1678688 RepID=UPI0030DAE566|tara:strand:+ start:1519 stop:2751 length:1233 start_codon:yes stop_codon:yes gene_type:complete
MDTLIDRFLRYVKIDTQSDETSPSFPSTKKQLDLSRMLFEECEQLGLEDVTINEYGIVMATIPRTVEGDAPAIGWVAHVDTSPEFSGTHVKPIVHENYDGQDLVLPGDPSRVLRVSEEPRLKQMVGKTVITTDGTTLLGADDKSGVAVMMTAAAHLMNDRSIQHGPIRLCFTCDEEIGRGIEKLDLDVFGVCCAYTLDSDGSGRIDSETFSADQAVIDVRGVNTHPSVGKGVMVNAIRILSDLISRMPTETLSPETTDGREGFMHPYHIEGGVAEASARLILRDFETEKLTEYAQLLESLAEPLREKHPKAEITITIHKQYRNMRDGLPKEPRALEKAIAATRAAGLEPNLNVIRGGTDGSLLTEKGLPTPNLSSGQHNPHSPLEWTSVEEMQQAVDVLVQLAIQWGQER